MCRTQVTNTLRLLKLDTRIQHWMKQGELSHSHGKILAGLPLDKQYWFTYEAIKKEWSVSTLDEAIKTAGDKKSKAAAPKISSALEHTVSAQFGYPVNVNINKNEAGSFRIFFHNREEIHAILTKLACDDRHENV